MKPEERDVVIVGSGPAGCATAMAIHNIDPDLSARVLVLESMRHPRRKVCAGGINGRVWHLLEDLGFNVNVPRVVVDRTLVRTAVGDQWLDAMEITQVVRRDEFDAAMAAHLPQRGIELRQGARVEHVRRIGDLFEISVVGGEVIRAKCVVGADGVGSVVRRDLFDVPDHTWLIGMATCPGAEHYSHTKKAIELDFRHAASGGNGYNWIFPYLEKGEKWINAGVCEWRKRPASDLKKQIAEYLDESHIDSCRAKYRFFPERPFHPRGPFNASGVILTGDAAGIDRFFGEGVSYAIEYGVIAGQTVADAMYDGDYSFRDYMRRLKWSRLGKELLVTWLASLCYYSRFNKLLTQAGFMDTHLMYLIGEVLAGRVRPSKKLAFEMGLRVAKNIIKIGANIRSEK